MGMNTAESTSGDADQCAGDLLHRFARGLLGRQAFLDHEPLDVLDHHDRIVDQQADGQHHGEHGQHVDREAAAASTAKVPSSTTGTAMVGISVARMFCRNTNMTMNTSAIASNRVLITSWMDLRTKGVVSRDRRP